MSSCFCWTGGFVKVSLGGLPVDDDVLVAQDHQQGRFELFNAAPIVVHQGEEFVDNHTRSGSPSEGLQLGNLVASNLRPSEQRCYFSTIFVETGRLL